MRKLRVLVVDDSLTVRQRLREVLASDDAIEVVGDAEDGQRAIELCRKLRPDVVTLDMILPGISGLEVTEYIMAHCPTPILIVSSSTNRGELFKTYDALAAGAVDALDKPRDGQPSEVWEREIIASVKLVARIKVITHPRARLGALGRSPDAMQRPPASLPTKEFERRVVAIGASTGGPGAIVTLLRGLSAGYPLPVLLVMHIGEPFGQAFADWLDRQTPHRVSCAEDNEPLDNVAGRIVIAPPGQHLVIRGGKLRLTSDPERHSCRPSIDVLFESVATEYGAASVGCLLTGMGKDGAAGMLAIRNRGGLTVAQDEATSVVYGMPREAVLLNAVDHVLPLERIGPALSSLDPPSRIPRAI